MMHNVLAGCGCAFRALALVALAALAACAQPPSQRTSGVERLYVLYCGEVQVYDLSLFSPGFNINTTATLSNNCYLIRHAKGWVLWDSGYPDALVEQPEGIIGRRSIVFRKKTLVAQMAEIGITPAQVTHVGFSHMHGDHVGNANLFTGATHYIQQLEHDAAFGPDPQKFSFFPAMFDKLRANPTVKLSGDYDVFSDGSVVILSTGGHTPGHQSLLVRLNKTGAIVLSGDVAHFQENFDLRRVPGFSFNRDWSIAAMDKVAAVMQKEKAQLWINHDNAQNATIRHAPEFYD
jgi:N-acyl homoserine lactone hydrolase